MSTLIKLLTTLLFGLGVSAALAQNVHQEGDIIVHHNVVPTTTLPPDVATQHGITRSANRALVNVVVQRRTEAPLPMPITAKVEGHASALTGQRQSIRMREAREGDAIYYLGEVRVQDKEHLNFEITVLADGASAPITLRFSQQFFVD